MQKHGLKWPQIRKIDFYHTYWKVVSCGLFFGKMEKNQFFDIVAILTNVFISFKNPNFCVFNHFKDTKSFKAAGHKIEFLGKYFFTSKSVYKILFS